MGGRASFSPSALARSKASLFPISLRGQVNQPHIDHFSDYDAIGFGDDAPLLVQPGRSKPAATKGVITGVNLE